MTDYVEIFVARGDKGTTFDSLYDGYLVDYRDPDLHGTANRKLSEHMLKCYQCLIVKRSDFEQKIKAKFGANADVDQDAFRSAKGKVDYSALVSEAAKARIDCPDLLKIRSADASPVIDCRNLDVSKFIVDTLTNGRETGVKDLMLVGSGEYTVGVGGDYETFALALADGDDVAVGNTLKFTEISDISGTQSSIYNKKLEGTLIIDGQNYLMENSVDGNVMTIYPATGSTGNIKYENFRIGGTGNLTADRFLIYTIAAGIANILFLNCAINGNGLRYSGIVILSSTAVTKILRSKIVGCSGSTGVYGLLPYAEYPDLLTVENCVFDSNYQHIRNRSKAYVYRSTAFLRASTDNIKENTNSISVNCATDQATVGAGTDTNPVVNINIENEFVNTDIDDLTNGYKCKRSGTIYALGAAPTLAENTTDIFGNPVSEPYEIGVGRQQIVNISSLSPSSAKRGATITVTATGLDENSTGTFTDSEETVHNLTLTATETGYTFTVPEEAALGVGTVTITNGDGQSDTIALSVVALATITVSDSAGTSIAIGCSVVF